jgi:uncharacterized protein involved in exopolysaccharide biosynthesis
MTISTQAAPSSDGTFDVDPKVLAHALKAKWGLVLTSAVVAGCAGLAVSFVLPPTFTARTSFLPPQQQQSAAASALASLGALSSLAGMSSSLKSPGDQYVSLLQSVTVSDRIIDKFDLLKLYDVGYREEARRELAKNVRITLGKKDGLIVLEADAPSAQVAADIANQYVDELRKISTDLALTEAQQRRRFFESEMKRAKEQLAQAQTALQSSGFNAGAIRAEPKVAADRYARLQAEATAAQVKLQAMRQTLTDAAPEVAQQMALLNALQRQVSALEQQSEGNQPADYLGHYRDFKYQEALFEIFSKQYELARVDESREGALIQVVDGAQPPERKSKPKRTVVAGGAAVAGLLLAALAVCVSALRRRVAP